MDWLDQELKAALARKDPSADFAGRVIRRAELPPARVSQWPRWLAAAAAVVVMAGLGLGYRQYRGERAKDEMMKALRIASVKVNEIRTHVREVGQ